MLTGKKHQTNGYLKQVVLRNQFFSLSSIPLGVSVSSLLLPPSHTIFSPSPACRVCPVRLSSGTRKVLHTIGTLGWVLAACALLQRTCTCQISFLSFRGVEAEADLQHEHGEPTQWSV